MRTRGGGGGRGWSMLAAILGAPEENPYFGSSPGDVPFDYEGDPSKLVAKPFNEDNVWGKMQGSPATRANMSALSQQEHQERAYAHALERARMDAILKAEEEQLKRQQDILDASPGGLLEQQKAAGYRAEIAGDNMRRENSISTLFPTISGDIQQEVGTGPRAATAPTAVRSGISDLINRQGLKNVVDNGLINAQSAADSGVANARMAGFNAATQPAAFDLWQRGQLASILSQELGNDEKEAGRWSFGSIPLGTGTRVFGDGRFIGLNKGREGSPAFGIPGKDGYVPAVPATPDSPFMGGVPGAFAIPGIGSFAPRKTPEIPAGTTFLDSAPRDAKEMKRPKQPELKPAGILGDFMDYIRASGGKREGESWAEYEKRKNK